MKFTHLRDDDGHPFATIAEYQGNVGMSLCSEFDQFSKKTGRRIAAARCVNGFQEVPDSPRVVQVKGDLHFASNILHFYAVSKTALGVTQCDEPLRAISQ